MKIGLRFLRAILGIPLHNKYFGVFEIHPLKTNIIYIDSQEIYIRNLLKSYFEGLFLFNMSKEWTGYGVPLIHPKNIKL